jgi:hypothetical protein
VLRSTQYLRVGQLSRETARGRAAPLKIILHKNALSVLSEELRESLFRTPIAISLRRTYSAAVPAKSSRIGWR